MKTILAFILAAWMAVWPCYANPLLMLAGSPPAAGGGVDLTDGLLAYYQLDETSGTTSDDAVGSSNLTMRGTLTSVTGKLSNAWASGSEGNTAWLTSGDVFDRGSGSFTIAAWIYPTGSSWYPTVVGLWGSTRTWRIIIYNDNTIHFQISPNGSDEYEVDGATLSNNQWYLIVGAYDGSEIKLSVNGGAYTTASYTLGAYQTDMQFSIHSRSAENGDTFVGRVDEVGFWSRALSSDEVSALYNDGNGLAFADF